MDVFQAALVRAAFWLVRLTPVRLVGAVGAGLGRAGFYMDKRHRRITERNLARIYPGRPRSWRRRVARESFAELGRTIFELPHVFLRSGAFLKSRVRVDGEKEFRAATEKGKGVFVAACHHSNWELGALMFSLLEYDADFLYRTLRQPSFDAYLKRCRERFGATLHPRRETLRWLPKTLKRGSCVPFMIDQHIGDGIPVPFLGHLANTITLPAAMVFKYDIPVFGVALHRVGRAFRFRLQLWPIDMPPVTGDSAADTYRLMHCICKGFEPVINQRPELWLWSHQRWKLLEEHYREISEVVHGTP